MISLRLRATVEQTADPFVVRLPHPSDEPGDDFVAMHTARRMDGGHDCGTFATSAGTLRLELQPDETVSGDVLLVLPQQKLAHRLVRSTSTHNTFLITERCDQICVMCSQPPKNYHVDLFQHFALAAKLAPKCSTIGLSGGEPTLYKEQIFALLSSVLSSRPDLRFHVLTNAQHFDQCDVADLTALPHGSVTWGVPLYSPFDFQHDEIVGKVGAHKRVMEGLVLLARSGAAIELRTVLLKPNVDILPLLAMEITRNLPFVESWAIMQLESIGYGRKNWDGLFFDNSRDFSMIGRALDIAHARGMTAALYNFPRCSVPKDYRAHAPSTISDWKRKYIGACSGCPERTACGGFFHWYNEAKGFERVGL